MRAVPMKNFHLPLPAALYTNLREAAVRNGAPATDLAREAIQVWLKEERRRKLREELHAYVDAVAGTVDDYDPAISAAGAESLHRADPSPDWSGEPSYPESAPSVRLVRNSLPAKRRAPAAPKTRPRKAAA